MAQAHGAYGDRPRRRGRKVLIGFVVLLLVLGGLLVVVDRVAAGVAERAIAEQVRQEVARKDVRSGAPTVEVAGFPFVTQVLDGKYERISIVLTDVQGNVQGDAVSVPRLDVDAHNVRASLDTLRTRRGDVVAERVDGRATVSYDSMAKLLDRPGLTLGERDGKLVVTAPADILGTRLTVTGTADLTVTDGKVGLRFDDLTAEGLPNLPLARRLLANYANSISVNLPLPELPFQLTVRKVEPKPDGLLVTADAQNVPINTAG
ncbi:DUF2993 domain-containing protein [Micromonospora eburnea]|uniref:DUF2993 domain-containing protein n=1 Tax=Micromonospora eburnea TaxID=227316 RepID=A0A1C6VKY5_9ACTN|nr:DUF2993 domain-containing protein [Micromonospora eburnea]SCL66986.1 Protein of unknown function [Micromonospora eburnea]